MELGFIDWVFYLGLYFSPFILVFLIAGLCGWYRGSDDPGSSC
jgi:hypothetical protein